MPLNSNKPIATASSAARSVGRRQANNNASSTRPSQVHSGTSQLSAQGPSHLPNKPGTMR